MKERIRRARGLVSVVRLVRDPSRLDEVFTLADTMVTPEILDALIDEFRKDSKGARALVERPRLGRIDVATLRALPEGTLGRVYADHLAANGLDPAKIPSLPADDPRSFVRAHLYEVHDVWHAVTGFGADVAGELGLQAFGMAQFPSRLGFALVAGGLFHTVLSAWGERDARMREIVRGWLMGRRAEKLFGVRWSEMWTRPIAEVRNDFGIDLDADEPRRAA